MIVKLSAGGSNPGSDTLGLLSYLYGPGEHQEHTDPHMVAAWDDHEPDPAQLSPGGLTGGLIALGNRLNTPALVHSREQLREHV